MTAMVNQPISDDLKQHAVTHWNRGWGVEHIRDALRVSRSSCYRWKKIFEEHGEVNRPPSPLVGHTRKTALTWTHIALTPV